MHRRKTSESSGRGSVVGGFPVSSAATSEVTSPFSSAKSHVPELVITRASEPHPLRRNSGPKRSPRFEDEDERKRALTSSLDDHSPIPDSEFGLSNAQFEAARRKYSWSCQRVRTLTSNGAASELSEETADGRKRPSRASDFGLSARQLAELNRRCSEATARASMAEVEVVETAQDWTGAQSSEDEAPAEAAKAMRELHVWTRREKRLSSGMDVAKALVGTTTLEVVAAAADVKALSDDDSDDDSDITLTAPAPGSRRQSVQSASNAWDAREKRLSVASQSLKAVVATTPVEIVEATGPAWDADGTDEVVEGQDSCKACAEESWRRREHRLSVSSMVPVPSVVEVVECRGAFEDADNVDADVEDAALDAWNQREKRLSATAASLKAMVTHFEVEIQPQNTDAGIDALDGDESDDDAEALQRAAWAARERRLTSSAEALKAVVAVHEVEIVEQATEWSGGVDSDEDTDSQDALQRTAEDTWKIRERRLTAGSIVAEEAVAIARRKSIPSCSNVEVVQAPRDVFEGPGSDADDDDCAAGARQRRQSAMWQRRERRLTLAVEVLRNIYGRVLVDVAPSKVEWGPEQASDSEAAPSQEKHELESWRNRERRLSTGRASLKARMSVDFTEVAPASMEWTQAPPSDDDAEPSKEMTQLQSWQSRERRLSATADTLQAAEVARRRSSISSLKSTQVTQVHVVEAARDIFESSDDDASAAGSEGAEQQQPPERRPSEQARLARNSLTSWGSRERRLTLGAESRGNALPNPEQLEALQNMACGTSQERCDADLPQVHYASRPPPLPGQRCSDRCTDTCSLQ